MLTNGSCVQPVLQSKSLFAVMGQETCQYTLRLLLPSTGKHQSTSCHNDRLTHIIGGSCRKYHFFAIKREKHVFVGAKTRLLSPQKYACFNFCHDKTFLARNTSRDKHVHTSRTTKDVFCHDKHVFVATKPFLRQKLYL